MILKNYSQFINEGIYSINHFFIYDDMGFILECSECKGSGEDEDGECRYCEGSGEDYDNGETIDCFNCDGTGVITIDCCECAGKGAVSWEYDEELGLSIQFLEAQSCDLPETAKNLNDFILMNESDDKSNYLSIEELINKICVFIAKEGLLDKFEMTENMEELITDKTKRLISSTKVIRKYDL